MNIKELCAWVRNNWRPYSSTFESNATLKVNPIHVVWQTHKDAVEEELKDILGVTELDTRDPGYFQQRNSAAKRVLDKMSELERAEIDSTVQSRRQEGNPEPIRHE
jgi:hypothetical protein